MEQEKKKTTFRNSVRLVGYLKETTLEEKVSQSGKHFITGNITVALDEFNTHRVRFVVFKEDNADKYASLSKFLPANTVSIASYLKATPTANFTTASAMAAKIWVMATMEEFASRSGEKEKSMMMLKGFSIGLVDAEKPFVPTAAFEADAYIDSIEDELDDDDTVTGRLLIGAILPAYKGMVYRIPLVAPVEDNIAKYMKKVYKVGDTARLSGRLVAMRVQLANEEETETEFFGKVDEQQYTTRFVREIIIEKGPKTPIAQGEEGSISSESIKNGLALREVEMDKNGQKKSVAQSQPDESKPAEAPVAKTNTAASNKEDFDF